LPRQKELVFERSLKFTLDVKSLNSVKQFILTTTPKIH